MQTATTEAPVAPEATAEAVEPTPIEASTAQGVETSTSAEQFDADEAIEGMDYESLERTLDELAHPTERKEKPAAAPTPAPAAVETPAEETDADDGETLTKNFRFHTEDPKLSAYLKTLKAAQKANPAVNPIDIARLVGYEAPGATAAPASAPAPVATPAQTPPEVQALHDQIAALETQIEEESSVNYDHAKALKLERQRSEKVAELRDLQMDLAAQAEAYAEYQQGFQASRERAWAMCPESQDPNSIQFNLIRGEVAQMKTEDPASMSRPDLPLVVLDRLTKRFPQLFTKAKAAPAATPAPTAPAARAPLNPSRPVGAVVAGNAVAQPISAKAAEAQLDDLSMEQLIELADKVGTTRETLRRGK